MDRQAVVLSGRDCILCYSTWHRLRFLEGRIAVPSLRARLGTGQVKASDVQVEVANWGGER